MSILLFRYERENESKLPQDDPKTWIPWEAVKKEMETKYGVKFGTDL